MSQSQFDNPNRDVIWIVWRTSGTSEHSPTWIIDAIVYTREQCDQYKNIMGRVAPILYQEWELDADRPAVWRTDESHSGFKYNPNRKTVHIVWREVDVEKFTPAWVIDSIFYTFEQAAERGEDIWNEFGHPETKLLEWELDADSPEGWIK